MDLKGGNFPDLIRRRFGGSRAPDDFSPRRVVGDLPPGFLPKQPWRPASVLLPLITHPEPTVLLTKRTDQLHEHAGQVSFPGGGREAQDADPVATALRETHEEIGLVPSQVEVVGYLRGYLTITGYAVTPVVGLVRPGFSLNTDPLEVAEVFEVPIAFLADPKNREIQTRELGGENVGFYLYRYQGQTIWGATAAMLVNFLNTLEGGMTVKQTRRLLEIMAQLRDPERGCPWDKQQTFKSIAPYTLEEAYEVADAIERGDLGALREELGDLLLQVVYHARMAEEAGLFGFEDVATGIGDKLVSRHPHVFAAAEITDAAQDWEMRKAGERAAKSQSGTLDGIPVALPGLTRAEKLQKRAARVGFDWPELMPVFAKIREEVAELEREVAASTPKPRLEDELGDVLFAVANLARKLGVDPEQALRGTNAKFERRFRHVEARLADHGKRPGEASLEEMDGYWDEAKARGL